MTSAHVSEELARRLTLSQGSGGVAECARIRGLAIPSRRYTVPNSGGIHYRYTNAGREMLAKV